jgi:hypothetical protein
MFTLCSQNILLNSKENKIKSILKTQSLQSEPILSLCRSVLTLVPACVFQKGALMEQIAHQAVVMQFIMEMAKNCNVDPRGCFRLFFQKAKVSSDLVLLNEKVGQS